MIVDVTGHVVVVVMTILVRRLLKNSSPKKKQKDSEERNTKNELFKIHFYVLKIFSVPFTMLTFCLGDKICRTREILHMGKDHMA